MNIGIDARALSYSKAGIGTYLSEVLEYIAGNDDCNRYYLYTNKDIDCEGLDERFVIRKYKSKIGTFGLRYIVPKMIKEDKIDVFWGPEHVLPKKEDDIKYVLTIHDLALFRLKKTAALYNEIINKIYCKKSAEQADSIIAISNSTKNDLVHLFGINPNKIPVIYNGVSLYPYSYVATRVSNSEFEPLSDKFGINQQYFLFVGTIEPRKNLVNAVKAFNLFKSKTGSPYKYVIAGGKGWRDKKIHQEIENSPYKNDIILTGYVSSKEKELLYRNALCLLFPSLYEGFGLPIIESLSVGTPVITSNVSAMPEVGGDVCEYVDPLNVANISDAMVSMVNDWKNGKVDESKLVNQSKKFNKNDFARLTYEAIVNTCKQ